MDRSTTERFLLGDLLKQVSRSFYLTLSILPASVTKQIGLAYLFARAADTIADSGQVDRSTRLLCLQQLKTQFLRNEVHGDDIRDIQARIIPHQPHRPEQVLIEQLERCFELYHRLTPEDQQRIGALLPILISGMEMDLTVFPGDSEADIVALPAMADLDRYTYCVAGCVGEFWTNMMCAHQPRLVGWDRSAMAQIGIRFGKGLQLTNILKDLPHDLRRGRCYIPAQLLEEVGLQPEDLLNKESAKALRPVFRRLVEVALTHLDQGWIYAMSIPRLEIRLRLACMWPILIGIRTLERLIMSHNLLDPSETVKISRGEIYRILAVTTLTGGCGYIGTAYWGAMRKRIV